MLLNRRGVLLKSIYQLKPREKRVLIMRFGLDGCGETTLKEIGNILGISRARVRQIEQNALRRLRHPRFSKHLKQWLVNNATPW